MGQTHYAPTAEVRLTVDVTNGEWLGSFAGEAAIVDYYLSEKESELAIEQAGPMIQVGDLVVVPARWSRAESTVGRSASGNSTWTTPLS